jgi:hypothetical protein
MYYVRITPVLKDLSWACRRNEPDNRLLVKEFFYRLRPMAEKFIAYFQTFTNTYAPVVRLGVLYDEALAEEDNTPCLGIIPGEVKRFQADLRIDRCISSGSGPPRHGCPAGKGLPHPFSGWSRRPPKSPLLAEAR